MTDGDGPGRDEGRLDRTVLSMPARGRLIALEGIDGCGKSTQAKAVAAALGALLTHEPGATPLGALLRRCSSTPDPVRHRRRRGPRHC